MNLHADRLESLRAQMRAQGLDAWIVPIADEHLSEYIGAYAQRLAWLTGFTGSAATAVVLLEEAAIFVDGRYTLQVREEVDAGQWQYLDVTKTTVGQWLADRLGAQSRVGYDSWLHAQLWVRETTAQLSPNGAQVVPIEGNLIDAIWTDRPSRSVAPVVPHALAFAGQSSAAKIAQVSEWLRSIGADAVVLCALDSIAWTFNIRGRDIEHTPVCLAYAIVGADGSAQLLVDPAKITPDLAEHLGETVRLRPRDALLQALADLRGARVAVDPRRSVAAICDRLAAAGAEIVEARDPAVLPKAIKNPVEIAGHRAAQVRDGAALSRFLHWLSAEGPREAQTELSIAARLQAFREATGALVDTSFRTIAGHGRNGAVVHYSASERTDRRIEPGTLLLVDSGGQYRDGTTDVTRTVAIGTPSSEMRRRFTLVLKGHIALATALFPQGTRGGQLDVLARQYLWAEGLDYAHGTGHGVGSFLGVHEGPQRIAANGDPGEELHAGMILSNEPGYYKAGEYGIRIENLVVVEARQIDGSEQAMLGFETLTFAPLDRALIDISLLTGSELDWINDYHAEVERKIGFLLEGPARDWLEAACAPIFALS